MPRGKNFKKLELLVSFPICCFSSGTRMGGKKVARPDVQQDEKNFRLPWRNAMHSLRKLMRIISWVQKAYGAENRFFSKRPDFDWFPGSFNAEYARSQRGRKKNESHFGETFFFLRSIDFSSWFLVFHPSSVWKRSPTERNSLLAFDRRKRKHFFAFYPL